MQKVKPKKQLGQHFLVDLKIAHDIVDALKYEGDAIEIGRHGCAKPIPFSEARA